MLTVNTHKKYMYKDNSHVKYISQTMKYSKHIEYYEFTSSELE